jgi:hypothetical protein
VVSHLMIPGTEYRRREPRNLLRRLHGIGLTQINASDPGDVHEARANAPRRGVRHGCPAIATSLGKPSETPTTKR